MKKITIVLFLCGLCTLFCSFISPKKKTPDDIPFPDDYRSWTHIKTAISNPSFASHAGFHHIYANKEAMEGYRTGRFPDGAIIAFDVLESVRQTNEDIVEGKRKLVDVMVKDSLKFAETGGWGYEEFIYTDSAARKLLHPVKAQCYNCHASQKEAGYVFSKYRE